MLLYLVLIAGQNMGNEINKIIYGIIVLTYVLMCQIYCINNYVKSLYKFFFNLFESQFSYLHLDLLTDLMPAFFLTRKQLVLLHKISDKITSAE